MNNFLKHISIWYLLILFRLTQIGDANRPNAVLSISEQHHFVYKYLSHRPSRSERNILAWGNRSPEALSAVKTFVVINEPRWEKTGLLLSFTCNYVVFVWRGFLFLWVLGMGYVILLWHSLSLPYNYSGFPTSSDTNRTVQPQEMTKCLKFRI